MMKKLYETIFSLLILFCLTVTVKAVDADKALEYEVKAAMIEKISFFVDWQTDKEFDNTDDVFLVGLVGDNQYIHIFQKYFNDKKIDGQTVNVVHVEINDITKCDLLFINDDDRKNVDIYINMASENHIFTVSDSKGYGKKGVHVNFFIYNRRVRFEINLKSAKQDGFAINSLLLNYAKRVIK